MYQLMELDNQFTREWLDTRMLAVLMACGPPSSDSVMPHPWFFRNYDQLFGLERKTSELVRWHAKYRLWWLTNRKQHEP